MNRILAAAAIALALGAPAFAGTAEQGVQCDYVSKALDKTTFKELPALQQNFQHVFEFTADGKMFGFAKLANGKPLSGLAAELSPYTVTTTPGHYIFTRTYLAHGVGQFNIDRVTGVMSGHEFNPDASVDFYFEGACAAVTLPEPKL